MKKKISGEVTIEAAIVVPLILLIVISLIYFAIYIHDLVIIKSYAYSAGVESVTCNLEEFSNNVKLKLSKSPSLVITPIVKCYQKNDSYFIEIRGISVIPTNILDYIIKGTNIKMKIQKSISRKNIYIVRGIIDLIGE